MWIAHYASGLIAKPFAPDVPLSLLALAGALPDAFFFVLNLGGLESFSISSKVLRKGGCFPYNADYPFSHSLLGMGYDFVTSRNIITGSILAFGYSATKKKASVQDMLAIVMCSLSHFLLEVPTHRHDTKITPTDNIELGAGLFDYPSATLAVELAIFFGGLWEGQRWRLYALSIFMIAQQIHFCYGSAPTSETRFVHAPMFLFNILLSCWALGKLES
ncbi:SubName: Full=Uncharacterized protein {ECO:0000313/EMBL:CCA76130.1} [Serendipita indica DSM 11827]|nr:SubName: Full=Uncharacterized protein {ECO:0000313/EMBL:CCA76130.1} [Serendipita indica DSM 11827]